MLKFLTTVLLLLLIHQRGEAQTQKENYFAYIHQAAELGWENYPAAIANWKNNVQPNELWGYNAPGFPIYLADILGFLYQETGDEAYARKVIQILSEYGDLREAYPDDFNRSRAEYIDGIPALANFFYLPPYLRSYLRVKNSRSLEPDSRIKIEEELSHSLDFVFFFPEWGAHNRAMLRAEGLYYGAVALAAHPNAAKWKQMAETIAGDNLSQWEIEDASIYQPVWLSSLFSYAETTGRNDVFKSPVVFYYADYFKQLITPARTIPDFGDATWNPNWYYYVAVFEKLATAFNDAELKWAAEQLFEKAVVNNPRRSVTIASLLALAYRWANDLIVPRQPVQLSREVLDDIVGKKIVFRNGWEPESTYLLLNYRDEGDGGFVHREFLRNTLSVEEEKMHHGHADEQDISLLMSGGSVLLHDGGYRDGLPSGAFGGYRADYFHNRLVVRKNKRDNRQSLVEFIRNSGAYRQVRTRKVDFLTFQDVDYGRTRLTDENVGYIWDRLVAYVKPEDLFIVVDAVKITKTDYYTFTNLWHTQSIHEKGSRYYDTSIDSIGSVQFPEEKRLLIRFLDSEAKTDGIYVEQRHDQEEHAIYQTISSHYFAGDMEVFVTALVPHGREIPPSHIVDRISLMRASSYPEAVSVEIEEDDATSYLCLKLDLQSELVPQNIRPRYTWDSGKTTYGEFETDAHFLYATVRENTIHWAASEMVKVLYAGHPLMEALPNTHGLQLDGTGDRVGYVKWRSWEDTYTREE